AGKCDGKTGTMTFGAIDTTATGGQPIFDEASTIQIELNESNPFPVVRFRLKVNGLDKAAWQKAVGADVPTTFLNCRMDSPQFFYRGGFLMALPAVDPFPVRSAAMRGPWDGDWTYAVDMAACPVPAVGVWDAEGHAFVAYEFQEARCTDKSSRRVASAYCAGLPKEKKQFAGLILPEGETESRFRLIYATDLSAMHTPNQFVIEHIWATYRDRLPGAPAATDLGWMPRRDAFIPDGRTTAHLIDRIMKNSPDPRNALFTDGAVVPAGDFRGVSNLFAKGKNGRKKHIQDDWAALKAKAIKKRIGKDDCVFWRLPVEGEFEEFLGGQAAAAEHSPATWCIGAALLGMVEKTKDTSLLPFIDGIFRWARHCLATRAGDPSLPGATSVRAVDACAVEFLLHYHHLFANAKDRKRRSMAEEALALGRSALYRSLAVYTGDPDPTDNLNPTFLIQPNSARSSAGIVGWRDTGKLIRAMVLYYIETGDPILGDLIRGALQRWPLGVEADGFHTIEALDVYGIGPDTKGRRMGWLGPDRALAEYIQPVGSAKARVVCGPKAGLAFCVDAAVNIRDYKLEKDGTIRFDLVGDVAGVIDINVTTPLRSLRGRKIVINGKPAEVEVVGLHGENAIVRGVTVRKAPKAEPPKVVGKYGDCALLDFPYNGTLDTSWANGLSWAGLVDGVHFAWGVPFRIGPGEKKAVDLSEGACGVRTGGQFTSAFLFVAGRSKALVATVVYGDGKKERHELGLHLPALSAGPIRSWRIDMCPLKVKRAGSKVDRIEVVGDGLLFAVTTHPSTSSAFKAALAKVEAKRKAREAEVRRAAELKRAQEQIVPDLRAKVAAATRGKTLRIAFLPPHESYTEILRTACSTLGSPPALLSPEEVIDPKRFNPERYAIAVYSAPETFLHTVKKPGDAAEALKRYVAGGGCLIVAARGYPLFYATRPDGEQFAKIKGLPNSQTCSALEVFISGQRVPPLEEIPTYALVSGQKMFTHLPASFRYERGVGGPYRPITGEGLPKEDVFKPVIVLKDGAGKEHGIVAAEVVHNCKNFKGGRIIFLWGNILGMETGPTIALDLISHAICTTKLKAGAVREPQVAILPRDMAGHDQAIERACAAVGLRIHKVKPEEFADPAIFNPRNFPIAIHAVTGEYYLNKCAGRDNLWQVYVDYVKGGGFLIACGTMYQFYYAGTLAPNGKYTQKQDGAFHVLSGLGLKGGGSRIRDNRPKFLKCLPDQNIMRFDKPIPLEYLHWGTYRSIDKGDTLFDVEFIPIGEVVDESGNPFGGYAIAAMRYTSRELKGAEMLWMWGDMLNDARAYPLLNQAVKYAYEQRKAMFGRK
ncbi:MAG: hypothetical protein GXP25_01400, partial [Planctomycetes bacterium]|nr:hypothetical protein [Planctomycetota bacterium]